MAIMSTLSSMTRGQRRRLLRAASDRRGVAASEFAMLLPLLVIALAGVYEMGSYINEAANLDKSLRAGAMLASRAELPLSNSMRTNVENVVKTGSVDGSNGYVLNGWSKSGADLRVTTTNFTVDGRTVPVIRLEATVPYEPFASGVLTQLGFTDMKLVATHEQAHIGN